MLGYLDKTIAIPDGHLELLSGPVVVIVADEGETAGGRHRSGPRFMKREWKFALKKLTFAQWQEIIAHLELRFYGGVWWWHEDLRGIPDTDSIKVKLGIDAMDVVEFGTTSGWETSGRDMTITIVELVAWISGGGGDGGGGSGGTSGDEDNEGEGGSGEDPWEWPHTWVPSLVAAPEVSVTVAAAAVKRVSISALLEVNQLDDNGQGMEITVIAPPPVGGEGEEYECELLVAGDSELTVDIPPTVIDCTLVLTGDSTLSALLNLAPENIANGGEGSVEGFGPPGVTRLYNTNPYAGEYCYEGLMTRSMHEDPIGCRVTLFYAMSTKLALPTGGGWMTFSAYCRSTVEGGTSIRFEIGTAPSGALGSATTQAATMGVPESGPYWTRYSYSFQIPSTHDVLLHWEIRDGQDTWEDLDYTSLHIDQIMINQGLTMDDMPNWRHGDGLFLDLS